jgi:hypothetical protein
MPARHQSKAETAPVHSRLRGKRSKDKPNRLARAPVRTDIRAAKGNRLSERMDF